MGRIVRKDSPDIPASTLYLNCWVDRNKYTGFINDDSLEAKERRDAIMREDMSKGGNYSMILNITAALKQEDPDLYDLCLKYPNKLAPIEHEANARKHGYQILDPVGEGDLVESLEFMTDSVMDLDLLDLDQLDYDEIIPTFANENKCHIEIHTEDIENPIERYEYVEDCGNEDYGEEDLDSSDFERNEKVQEPIPTIRLLRTTNEDGNDVFQPMVKQSGKSGSEKTMKKRNTDTVAPCKKTCCVFAHTNDELKVLWHATKDLTVGENACVSAIDCEVIAIDREANWLQSLEQVKTYMDENRKRPSNSAKDKEIKTLGSWISVQLANYQNDFEQCKHSMKNKVIKDTWLQFITSDNYSHYFMSNEQQWFNNLEQVKTYIDTHKKRPSTVNKDKKIKTLASWIKTQQNNYHDDLKQCKQSMKNEVIKDTWIQFITSDTYSQYFLKQQWLDKLEHVKIYIDTHEKRPSAADKDKKIKTLGSWIGNQQKNYHEDLKQCKHSMKNEVIKDAWHQFITNDNYSQYFLSNEQQWLQSLEQVKTYIDENKKRPTNSNKYKKIKSLAQWIQDQQGSYHDDLEQCKRAMKNEVIRNTWLQFITSDKYSHYFLSSEQQWMQNLEQVKTYMDTHNKRPSSEDKDKKIKTLGSWIGNQQTNYHNYHDDLDQCKKSMKNNVIKNAWLQFITSEQYSKYFNQTETKETKKQTALQIPKEPKKTKEPSKKPTFNKMSDLGALHKTYHRTSASVMHQQFQDNPQSWTDYHATRNKALESYDPASIPCNMIIAELEKIQTKRVKMVVDMGCGEAPIAQHFDKQSDKQSEKQSAKQSENKQSDNKQSNKPTTKSKFHFHNYDHQTGNNPAIQQADISSLPLDDASVEIAIMSLAMWGTADNKVQYIKEAYRVLESGGIFYIADSTKKMSPDPVTADNAGLFLRTMLQENGFLVQSEQIGTPFCLFVCNKI